MGLLRLPAATRLQTCRYGDLAIRKSRCAAINDLTMPHHQPNGTDNSLFRDRCVDDGVDLPTHALTDSKSRLMFAPTRASTN